MKVKEIRKFSAAVQAGINKLIPQLTSSRKDIDEQLLRDIINSEDVHLFIAEDNDVIVGMLTLVLYPMPTDLRAIIEDVVVDAPSRGKGFGHKLIKAAIQMAKEKGARSVNLSSQPNRQAANALYQKMGFNKRETNVYRYEI